MRTIDLPKSNCNIDVRIFSTKGEMGTAAATLGAQHIRQALVERGEANIIVATGASQFEMLASLVEQTDIAWNRVTAFHLDEYVGLPIEHGASFRLYLWKRLVSQLPLPLRAFHYINAETDGAAECFRLGMLIDHCSIDVAFVGIGENGHLAFNDPPADFHIESPYILVDLDEACRRQQFDEGWFKTFDEVPTRAISMSIHRIMQSHAIVCTVPDVRKSQAVRDTLEGPVTPIVPASILQRHPQSVMFLDEAAATRLTIG
jgi:glucosamine-6-phosphate deaminase